MPGIWHDSGGDILKDDPDLGRRLFLQAGGRLPPGRPLSLIPGNRVDRVSRDLIPDVALGAGSADNPEHVLIVEYQREQSQEKRRQLARYAAAHWLDYQCPVDVLVICPDEKTAEWYERPVETALRGYTHWPSVLRREHVPAFADSGQVTADLTMGVMSVAYHGSSPAVADAFAEGVLSLEPGQARKYYEYALGMSPKAVREALEHLMETKYQEPFSRLGLTYYRRGREEGLQEGRQEGRQEGLVAAARGTVLMVLKARGLKPSDHHRDLLDSCEDPATLKDWAEAAITATTADEVFGEA